MAGRKTDKDLIVLTGGVGFIGSCFLSKLNQQGEKNILVVDQQDDKEALKNLTGKQFIDLIDKQTFIDHAKPSNVKAIFHIGACSSTMETNADFLYKNNYEYSRNLAEWALEKKIPFHYASSAATYGDGSLGYCDDDTTSLKLKPLNLYGNSKQMFDVWIITNGLSDKVVGYKYFNVFGPNEYHKGEMRSLVVKAYQQIKSSGKIRLFKSYNPEYKDGEQVRDFVYIKDVVDLMFKFYMDPQIKGIFNVGTGQARTWNDLAKAIFSALKLEPNIEYIPMPEQIRDKYQYCTKADLTKLTGSGIKFSFRSLEEAVHDYTVNYLDKGCLYY